MRYFPSIAVSILALCLSFSAGVCAEVPAQRVALTAEVKGMATEMSNVSVEGRETKVWQTAEHDRVLTFVPSGSSPLPVAGFLYLEVTYLDKGYGRLTVRYPGPEGKMIKPDKFTRIMLADTGKWVTAELRLAGVPDVGVPKLQITLERNKDNNTLAVSRVMLQNTAFADAHFQYVCQEAWKRPYDGISAPGIDNQTLKGKVMVGYQGWFRTPNDPYDEGWIHWGDMNQGRFTTDMWPDNSAYDAEDLDKAADVKTLSGKPGYLFSPGWPEVVRTQFGWMRDHRIDGAFVQRFVGGLYAVNGHPEWVLGNVRAAANQQGRIWAVEYDVSGCPDDKLLEMLKKDWTWMVDEFGLKKDPSYAHERGKPVVFIWGMPFADRKISLATANAVMDFFKNDPVYGGNYVIGGIPGQWRKMDAGWQEHFRRYDGVLEWMSKDYSNDVADWKKAGIDYYPHVWPGFSWANLKHLPTGATEQFTPRAHGQYYENLISRAAQAGADRLFVGMFDEYDESTAIIPMSDDPPPTPREPGTSVKFFPVPGLNEHPETAHKEQVALTFDGTTAPAKGTPPNNFSMRWEGQLIVPAEGDYTFDIEGAAGDAAALWIDGKQVLKIARLGEGNSPGKALTLKAGQPVVYRLEYNHGTATGALRLTWQRAGGAREEVPAAVYVDAWGRFLTNEGDPPDLYLKLTSEAKDMITGKRAATDLSVK